MQLSITFCIVHWAGGSHGLEMACKGVFALGRDMGTLFLTPYAPLPRFVGGGKWKGG